MSNIVTAQLSRKLFQIRQLLRVFHEIFTIVYVVSVVYTKDNEILSIWEKSGRDDICHKHYLSKIFTTRIKFNFVDVR